mgnify:CR=1 FL=1
MIRSDDFKDNSHMKKRLVFCLVIITGYLLLSATYGFSFSQYKTEIDQACAPVATYTPVSCTSCHNSNQAQQAYSAGGTALTDFFCPSSTPTCTDNDGDTYAIEGGDCGPVDCNDDLATINPGASEICGDGIDQNCDGTDPVCPPVCTDNDGDSYAIEGGDCGPVDCNDNLATVNPGANEICGDTIDQNCDGTDPVCPLVCTDNDGDTYAIEGGECGTVDCNDNLATINPGASEICGDTIDQNCDGIDLSCNSNVNLVPIIQLLLRETP